MSLPVFGSLLYVMLTGFIYMSDCPEKACLTYPYNCSRACLKPFPAVRSPYLTVISVELNKLRVSHGGLTPDNFCH